MLAVVFLPRSACLVQPGAVVGVLWQFVWSLLVFSPFPSGGWGRGRLGGWGEAKLRVWSCILVLQTDSNCARASCPNVSQLRHDGGLETCGMGSGTRSSAEVADPSVGCSTVSRRAPALRDKATCAVGQTSQGSKAPTKEEKGNGSACNLTANNNVTKLTGACDKKR